MRVPRFFARGEDRDSLRKLLESESSATAAITLVEADLLKQMRNVLRLGSGSKIIMLDNNGSEFELELERIDKSRALCKLNSVRHLESATAPRVELALALIKPERFEWCIEKLSELGVARVLPIICSRSVIKWQADNAAQKLKRWEAIAREACEQCERATIPDIVSPISFKDLMQEHSSADGAQRFICAERKEVSPLAKVLSEKISITNTTSIESVKSITLLVGPEGGFAEDELAAAQDHGWQPVSLGKNILRAETAAIAAMCQIASILDI